MANEKVAMRVDHLADVRDNLKGDKLVDELVDMLEY